MVCQVIHRHQPNDLDNSPTTLRWVIGTCSIQGKRDYNEDRFVVIPDLQKDAYNHHIGMLCYYASGPFDIS